ncbi:MAG: GNAT family N-acetyltransferase, partial [Bacteroidia bacterium]
MEIRKAREEDLPAIIELMKSSLGESRIPKSPKLWRWKHEENPFGKSYVLLAEESNEIIGLRTFMQWKWIWKGRTYRAVRAVDTATHPAHQGKGIFKKLTLQQAEICKNEGIDFVFNTPNDSSRPGYLKMGWVLQEKMPLKFKMLRPFSLAYSKFFDKAKYADINEDPSPKQEWDNKVLDLFDGYKQTYDKQLTNPITKDYIIWRYVNNPLYRYNYFTDYKNYVLISRIKLHNFAKELRITEFILLNPCTQNLSSAINKQVKKF